MSTEWNFPNRATPAGSSAYYSVRFAPPGKRNALAALLGWRRAIRAVLEEVSDPGVARLKLQWWREELQRAFSKKAGHPLGKALEPVIGACKLPPAPFVNMTWHVENEILARHPRTRPEFETACEQELGSTFELMARVEGIDDEQTLAAARRVGGFCRQVYLIRDSGMRMRKGRHFMPADELSASGLTLEALADPERHQELPQLLALAAPKTAAYYAAIDDFDALPASLRVRARILSELFNEIAASGYSVADRRICLTPLAKLWYGWRESRRVR